MTVRKIQEVVQGVPASDGAGVKLIRSLGSASHLRADPFLMLDAFSSENPDDYVAGFPSHPHRGFETVTYLLDGHMLHEDHLGNRGNLKSGGVQWMTAGRGIIHSEMPQQENGRMRGFQLWINLPAKEKMKPAGYRDIQADEIPSVPIEGGQVKVIAGNFGGTAGPVHGGSVDPTYWDVSLAQGKVFSEKFKGEHTVYVYPFEGSVEIEDRVLNAHQGGVLGSGDAVSIKGEPIVQYGPFVMNTREEIEQAVRDYQSGALTGARAA